MTAAVVMAGFAAAAGLLGAWEGLAAVETGRLLRLAGRLTGALRRLGDPALDPSAGDRRRLAVMLAGVLLTAGWLVAGPVAALLTALAGPVASVAVLRARRARRAAELAAGAAGAARALADAVAAGHSARGAVAVAAPSLAGATGRELRAAARALALGSTTEEVLERLRARAGGPAWDALTAAILLQRDAGGDLAALLRRLAASLEAAERQRAHARTMTAQARFTAWLVVGLPFGAAGVGELVSPGLIPRLVAEPLPATLTCAAAVLQAVAVVSVLRLSRTEVA